MRRKERVTGNVLDAVIQIISLAIVQNHLATKIKRPSLEVLGAIAKMTPKTKPTMKLVAWLNRQMRKQAHASHKAKNMVSTKRCLELLHMDLFGPSAIKSYGGNLYTLVVVDDYSRYTWTRFLKTKNEAFEKFEILSRKIQNQLGSSIIAIRTDHGREFDNEVQFGAYCDAQGITHNFSAPRTPQSNGVVERKNRTLQEMSRTMLNEQTIPQKFWCNAVDTSTYILNRILIRPILGKTPYEIFRGDYIDHKSTSGVCTFMGCCLTYWFAKKQTALAISMTEAEYVSAGKACQQALWMKQALIDYGIRIDDLPIIVQKGNISIEKVASEDNIADIFTKPLERTKMSSEYQQDYKKTRVYAPKIYNDPNMCDALRDIYRTLESRYVHEGRTIDISFYNDISDGSVAKFTAIGICIYSGAWGLDELEKTLEQIEPYNSCLPALDDIRNLIYRRTIHEKIDNKKEGKCLFPAIGNRDTLQAVIALMLKMSSLKAKQPKKPPPKRPRNIGKSKRSQLSTSSSTKSPPSDNGDFPSTKISPRSYIRAFKDDPNMSKEQREIRGMFKNWSSVAQFLQGVEKGFDNDVCMKIYLEFWVKNDVLVIFVETCDPQVHHMVDPEEQPIERTPSSPPRKKSLSPPQVTSKSISSKSTHYTSSSSPSESPTPTYVAPPPKLHFVISIKQEPQELPSLQISPNDPYAKPWLLATGPSNPSLIPPWCLSTPPAPQGMKSKCSKTGAQLHVTFTSGTPPRLFITPTLHFALAA
ncbi:retrovirus-related pol polyprotein from transposon TNT 1-94 [Tanacetum coccineum]